MKKPIILLVLIMLFLSLYSCKENNNTQDTQNIASSEVSSSTTTVNITTTTVGEKSIAKTTKQYDEDSKEESKYETKYQPNSDYLSWNFNDWINASDEQRKECLDLFSKSVDREVDESNLGKIFATNQNRNLTQIIEDQKANAVSQEGVQPDPGHGAAAGY